MATDEELKHYLRTERPRAWKARLEHLVYLEGIIERRSRQIAEGRLRVNAVIDFDDEDDEGDEDAE